MRCLSVRRGLPGPCLPWARLLSGPASAGPAAWEPAERPAAVCPAARSRAALALAALVLGCGAEEASRLSLPVHADARHIEVVETDRGYTVELAEARLALADLRFALAGEEHAASGWRVLHDWLVPAARAHPGHSSGGQVTGELLGQFVSRWLPESEAPLGLATLLEGDYESANFALGRAVREHGVGDGDPLLGHTALLRGAAVRGAERVSFMVLLDAPAGEALTGVPFDASIRADAPSAIGFELLPRDPFEGDTLFDGIDFARLARDAGGVVSITPDAADAEIAAAHERLLAQWVTPDHFRMLALPVE